MITLKTSYTAYDKIEQDKLRKDVFSADKRYSIFSSKKRSFDQAIKDGTIQKYIDNQLLLNTVGRQSIFKRR